MIKKIYLILGLMMVWGGNVLADDGIGIHPLKTELEMKPGEEQLVKMKVQNQGEEGVWVKGDVEVFSQNDEQGFPEGGEGVTGDWIDLSEMEVWIEGGEESEIAFLVRVPENASPGGKCFAVIWEPINTETGGIQIRTRVAALILVRVEGEVNEAGEVSEFEFDDKEIVSDEPLEFEVKFINQGNVHVKPEGKIWIFDESGEPVLKVGELNGKVVDFIPVNPRGGNVLPNSERVFVTKWQGEKIQGKFQARLELFFGDERKMIVKETEGEIRFGAKVKKFDWDGEKFEMVIENQKGTVIVRPEFWVEVWDENGMKIGQIEVNDDEFLLPGSKKEFLMRFPRELTDGKFQARLIFSSKMLSCLNKQIEFWVGMNPKIWGSLGGVLIIIVIGWGLWHAGGKKKIKKIFKKK